jgi:site-specific recombinase XerD
MRLTKRSLVPIRQSRALVLQRPDKAWAVYSPSNAPAGQRKVIRRYFRNKADAERYCSIARAELAALGAQANRLTDSLKLEALNCSEKLAPLGKSLTEAVEWFIKEQRSRVASVTVRQATEALLHRAKADGQAKAHLRCISSVMGLFGRQHGEVLVSDIGLNEVQNWLDSYRTKDGRPLSAVGYNSYRRYLGLLFSFGIKRGWASTNPLIGVRAKKVVAKLPRLLSPADLRIILGNAPEALKPVLAIQAFCGLRVAEAARLRWSDILFNESGNYVQVGADVAKTSRRRLTPISEGLTNYLKAARRDDGFVYEAGKGSIDALQRVTAGYRKSLVGVAWGRNALRASALSYRLALSQNAAATALESGNSATILTRFYAETAQMTVAQEWFGIKP